MFSKKTGTKNIIFTDTMTDLTDMYDPKPASKSIPQWYKNTPTYHTDGDHTGKKERMSETETPATIKKCLPVYDAMTSGYYLFTHCDISVIDKNDQTYFVWAVDPAIQFHGLAQVAEHPKVNKQDMFIPKFINRWAIETPPGYSTLFINPMHNPSGIFNILEGVVDTDKYTNPVNLPFSLIDPNWRGLIPAGTPFAQVIPFKRDSWEMSFGNDDNRKKQQKVNVNIETHFFDAYKRFFRSEKRYK